MLVEDRRHDAVGLGQGVEVDAAGAVHGDDESARTDLHVEELQARGSEHGAQYAQQLVGHLTVTSFPTSCSHPPMRSTPTMRRRTTQPRPALTPRKTKAWAAAHA